MDRLPLLTVLLFLGSVCLSFSYRKSRWVWFAWIPAVAISTGILIWVTWLVGRTFPMRGPGGGGEFIVGWMFIIGVATGGTLLFLLVKFHPTEAARNARSLALALMAWIVFIVAILAAVHFSTQIEIQFVVKDESGTPIGGTEIKWSSSIDFGAPFLPRLKSSKIRYTDATGAARLNIMNFDYARATISVPLADTKHVVAIYLDGDSDPSYRIQVDEWQTKHGRLERQIRRGAQFNQPRGRSILVPIIVTRTNSGVSISD